MHEAVRRVYHGSMELHVWKYLLTHSFQDLEDEHGVMARPNASFDKFSLNYDQLAAKNGDPVSEQCRGLIVRPRQDNTFWSAPRDQWKNAVVGDCDVLAWPMNRFYNHGDVACHDVDWSDPHLKVYEKVDGTCVIVYWDPAHKAWHCATRSVPEADLPIQAGHIEIGDMTFAQLFVKALVETREELSGQDVTWLVDGPDKVIHLNKELTYVFELVSPYNQIVVRYPRPRVYLLAARETKNGNEVRPETLRIEHVLRPKSWSFDHPATVAAFVNASDPSQLEGAVVCDSKFRRVKIKSAAYVLAHRTKDSVTSSPRNALEAVIIEKADDIVPLVPEETAKKILAIQDAYVKYCLNIDANVSRFKLESEGSRKRFAELVMLSNDWSAPYFNLWEGRATTAREWIKAQCESGKLSPRSLDTILSRLGL